MVVVISGKNWKGEDCQFYLNENHKNNLQEVKDVVLKKDFDYVAIICGLPGLGKSNFAISCAKFLDPNFTEKNIAFTSHQFIELTNNCPNHSAIILDESFASMNSKITMTKEFVQVINHLQIIRQKNLFIFLCLPNFFDLSKGIAIYRSSHLFVVYSEKFGERGRFAAFGREQKKMLYILGQKYMNYQAVKPNFRGQFTKQTAINEELYKTLKLEHLKAQNKVLDVRTKSQRVIDRLVSYLREKDGLNVQKIAEISGISDVSIYSHLKNTEKTKELELNSASLSVKNDVYLSPIEENND